MFQFPGFAPHSVSQLHWEGFTYSEIFGSKVICTSPELIAAYHVLHRLPAPRHSLCALYNLISLTLLKSAMSFVLLSSPYFPSILLPRVFYFLRPSLGTASILYLFLYPVCSCQRTFLFLRLRRQGVWLVLFCILPFFPFRSTCLLTEKWWTQLDLNQRPPPYQGGALTN